VLRHGKHDSSCTDSWTKRAVMWRSAHRMADKSRRLSSRHFTAQRV